MIDAMCAECVHFGASLFSKRPGRRCERDRKNQLEHDPTDQVCSKFRREGGLFVLDGEAIPVRIVNKESGLYDVEPAGECWRGKTIRVNISMLVDKDENHVGIEEVDSLVMWEKAVRPTQIVLQNKLDSIGMVNIPITTVRLVSERLVEIFEDIFTLGFSIGDVDDVVRSTSSTDIAKMVLGPAFMINEIINDQINKNSKGEDR